MIQRAEQFSPNSVEKDLAILEAVAERLRRQGHCVELVSEKDMDAYGAMDSVQLVFTMSRLPEALARLQSLGVRVINSPEGIRRCARSSVEAVMKQTGTPMPPSDGEDGYWLKRGDGAAQTKDDVLFAKDRAALDVAVSEMRQRGISDYTVSAHVKGDLVKFYGVRGTSFFRYYYPTDDGESKFGNEQHNGSACHYPFPEEEMRQEIEALAEAVGVEVYGGDCIVRDNGSYCVIDFNDWPSFSRCREEAAEAIVELIDIRDGNI